MVYLIVFQTNFSDLIPSCGPKHFEKMPWGGTFEHNETQLRSFAILGYGLSLIPTPSPLLVNINDRLAYILHIFNYGGLATSVA